MVAPNVVQPYVTGSANWDATSGLAPITDTTAAVVKAAGGASIYIFIDSLQLSNNSATLTRYTLRSNGVVRYAGVLAAAGAIGCRDTVMFDPPLRGVVNSAWDIVCETAGASVIWNVSGHTGSK